MALQMNLSGIRRNVKNLAHNYTDAQVKVREATSNDPWGPSSTLMSEIADLTYNVVAFSEIMQMVWKRLNDHGRNWRHVYKALVLLEYLMKTGSEKVADQCKENIFAIQTLKDFQYLEENKDQGMNVREKAKALVSLLKDDERLRNERVRALKAKERFAQSVSGIGSDQDINSPTSPSYLSDTYVTSANRQEREAFGVPESSMPATLELEAARPQTIGEEELQLQLALAMSKEEADQEEARKRSDDVRLQMAISQSETDNKDDLTTSPESNSNRKTQEDPSAINDLLDINFNPNNRPPSNPLSPPHSAAAMDPWGLPTPSVGLPTSTGVSPQHSAMGLNQMSQLDGLTKSLDNLDLLANRTDDMDLNDPWGSPISTGALSGPPSRVTSPPTTSDPWAPAGAISKSPEPVPPKPVDPWAPVPQPIQNGSDDPWKPVTNKVPAAAPDPFAPIKTNNDLDEFSALSTREKPLNGDVFDLTGLNENGLLENIDSQPPRPMSKSPAAFLGENSNLVNLDNLVSNNAGVSSAPLGGLPSTPSLNNMTNNNNNLLNMNPNNNINNNNNYNPFAPAALLSQSVSPSITGVNPFGSAAPPNPFQAQQAPRPSMNQLRTQVPGTMPMGATGPWGAPLPLVPNNPQDDNPFLV